MKETHAFANPGENHIIDIINPATNRSCINGETLEQIRLRYPEAVIVNLDEWMAAKYERQNTPLTWHEITEERYHDMMNCLPPQRYVRGAFLVGEPSDHCAKTGRPRYECFTHKHTNEYRASSRPMTEQEFISLFGK